MFTHDIEHVMGTAIVRHPEQARRPTTEIIWAYEHMVELPEKTRKHNHFFKAACPDDRLALNGAPTSRHRRAC